MSKLEKEARLLNALSNELGVLATLERFSLKPLVGNVDGYLLVQDCKVTFSTKYTSNGADEEIAMSEHISQLVAESFPELVDLALDRQRKTVEEARKALADFQNADWHEQLQGAVKADDKPEFAAKDQAAALDQVHTHSAAIKAEDDVTGAVEQEEELEDAI